MKDEVFRCPGSAHQGIESWRVRLDGEVLPHDWNSKGAALAAIPVERGRKERVSQTKSQA
jgi:hypothetical protein